jgi:membrane protein implicated in regulation of membrane protease activity
MNPTNSSLHWKQWIKPNRLIPLLTILGAGTAIVLSLLGVIKLSVAENIIIALLALLASRRCTYRTTKRPRKNRGQDK